MLLKNIDNAVCTINQLYSHRNVQNKEIKILDEKK